MASIKQVVSCIIILTLLYVFSSCSKEGAPGPQGPQGPAGNSEITSRTFTMSTWSYQTPHHYRNLSLPELTAKNIDSALVMVYFSTLGSNWFALPYTQYNVPSDYYMGFVTSVGNIQVTWFYDSSLSSGDNPNTYYGTTIKCKVVFIPPGAKKPTLNLNNYEEVKNAYHISD